MFQRLDDDVSCLFYKNKRGTEISYSDASGCAYSPRTLPKARSTAPMVKGFANVGRPA
jgi:hypothetical protein